VGRFRGDFLGAGVRGWNILHLQLRMWETLVDRVHTSSATDRSRRLRYESSLIPFRVVSTSTSVENLSALRLPSVLRAGPDPTH